MQGNSTGGPCPELRAAVAQGRSDLVQQQLMNNNHSVASSLQVKGGPRDRTVLHEAVWSGNVEMVQQLLAAGADPAACDSQEWTCLHLAAVRGFPEVAQVLLQHGADPQARDLMQRTPLHFTARSGSVGVAKLLLEHGASASAEDLSHRSPLHDAALRGSAQLVSLLLESAEDPVSLSLQKDSAGMVPLHCAAHRGHEAVVQQLLPALLLAPSAQATAHIIAAAVAAACSSYTQVAVMLIKQLGRIDPAAVSDVILQLQDRRDGSCSAVLAAVVLQWVADCAALPQQQEQLERDRQDVDNAWQRMQGMFLAVAGLMKDLHDADPDPQAGA